VHREVLDGVVDGERHRDLAPARLPSLEQFFRTEASQRRVRLRQHVPQPLQQLRPRNLLSLVELLLTIPLMLGAPGDVSDPHAGATFEVQQQIPDAVRRLARSPPHVFVAQRLEATLDLWQVI
jgi:hypothetical protein